MGHALKQMNMSIAWGLVAVWILAFLFIAISAAHVKPVPTETQLAVASARSIILTTPSTLTADGMTWRLELSSDGSVLQFIWNSGTDVVVWDSVVGACAPNDVGYAAMVSSVDYTKFLVTATTPVIFVQSYGAVQFRMVLYAGDVRIESTTGDNRYWSIFGPGFVGDPLYGLQQWPTGVPADTVLWQSLSLSGNLVAQFVGNGDLVIRYVGNSNLYIWSASSILIPLAC